MIIIIYRYDVASWHPPHLNTKLISRKSIEKSSRLIFGYIIFWKSLFHFFVFVFAPPSNISLIVPFSFGVNCTTTYNGAYSKSNVLFISVMHQQRQEDNNSVSNAPYDIFFIAPIVQYTIYCIPVSFGVLGEMLQLPLALLGSLVAVAISFLHQDLQITNR